MVCLLIAKRPACKTLHKCLTQDKAHVELVGLRAAKKRIVTLSVSPNAGLLQAVSTTSQPGKTSLFCPTCAWRSASTTRIHSASKSAITFAHVRFMVLVRYHNSFRQQKRNYFNAHTLDGVDPQLEFIPSAKDRLFYHVGSMVWLRKQNLVQTILTNLQIKL